MPGASSPRSSRPTRSPAASPSAAAELAALPTRGIGMTKRLLDHAPTRRSTSSSSGRPSCRRPATQTADFKEGVAAFLEKRPPEFGSSGALVLLQTVMPSCDGLEAVVRVLGAQRRRSRPPWRRCRPWPGRGSGRRRCSGRTGGATPARSPPLSRRRSARSSPRALSSSGRLRCGELARPGIVVGIVAERSARLVLRHTASACGAYSSRVSRFSPAAAAAGERARARGGARGARGARELR